MLSLHVARDNSARQFPPNQYTQVFQYSNTHELSEKGTTQITIGNMKYMRLAIEIIIKPDIDFSAQRSQAAPLKLRKVFGECT